MREAHHLTDDGEALRCTNNRDLAKGKQLVIKLRDHRRLNRVIATLTRGDMERNAEAVADRRGDRSRTKVEVWPSVHDTFAVTVVAGRGVFVPDQAEAAKRGIKK
jgi:hypothetical protein